MRNRIAALALAGLSILATSGCGQNASQNQRDADLKVYRHSMDGAPTNLDPVQSATIYSNFVTLNTYDTLFRYKYLKRPYELTTNLAAAMPQVSDDGLEYVIRLKKGVRFVDDAA